MRPLSVRGVKALSGLVLLTLFALSGCGSSPPPQSSADTAASGPAPCPESGTPCAKDGESCGAEQANKATTFSGIVRCQAGKWTRIEVPPPPPS